MNIGGEISPVGVPPETARSGTTSKPWSPTSTIAS